MINLDLNIQVKRQAKDVFAFVANPNNMAQWNSAVVSIEQVSPGAVGVGTKFKTAGEALGRRIEGELQVTAYQPDTQCGFQLNSGPMQVNITFVFEPRGSDTEIKLTAQGNPAGVLKLAEPVLFGQVKSMMEANLQRLKTIFEKA